MADLHLKALTGKVMRPLHASKRESRIDNADTYFSIEEIEECIDDILEGYRVLLILRGLPGSGKSHLAKSILKACYKNPNYGHHIHSADNFFMNRGKYKYDARQIGQAHQWNQKNVDYRMQEGYSPLIVDNTNTEMWEMKNYVAMAVRNGYKIRVLEVNTRWCFSCKDLTSKNQHNVPKRTIENMLARYEMGITAEQLLVHYQCPLTHQEQPLLRRVPPLFTLTVGSAHDAINPDLSLPRSKKKSKYEIRSLNDKSGTQENGMNGLVNGVSNLNLSESPKTHNYFGCWDTSVDNNVVKEWRIVETPTRQEGFAPIAPVKKPETAEIGTNTEILDFHLEKDVKVLYGRNREITETRKEIAVNRPGMLDKGCWTVEDVRPDRNEDLKKLIDIFQKVPAEYIRQMYDDCRGNFDMTFEIFLEDNKDYSHLIYERTNDQQMPEENSVVIGKNASVESLNEASVATEYSGPSPSTGAIKKRLPTTPKVQESTTPESSSEDECWTSPSGSVSDLDSQTPATPFENQNIELNLGDLLVQQLVGEFGDPALNFPIGFQPVVQLPKTLARQLYAFYVESVYQQMDNQKCILDVLVKEDETFARKLQEEENNGSTVSKPPPEGLQEIMNEQAALRLHKRQMPALKTPNDLATQLTKKKLFETFPQVEQDVILQLYHANKLNYKQTVDDLIASVGQAGVGSTGGNIREPPISESTMQELEEAHIDCEPSAKEDKTKSATEYREEAEYHLKKRNELYQKAREHHGKGQTEVAQFYSVLAQQQTKYYDTANNKAATVFLDENSKQLQNMNTLDLHYLFVKEAVSALDVFIDGKIEHLNATAGKQTQDLLIITGRGNRSANGVSKIRPAVIRRLEARNIRFHKMNPGLLKIKIRRDTPVTNDL
ncbi:uncharacterized protein LOC123319390 isoform X2 [Coccinella septempunctata]|nr:uncharacterized protein LOC123319390 isoform X2 [Coccinella septempunctata]